MTDNQARILVADDEVAIRQSLGSILGYVGYEVSEAEDGPSAIDRVRSDRIDLLLLDVKMPGMDGFEVITKLREEDLDLPVIVISGHDAVSNAVEAIRRGAYDFLEKPFKKEELLVRVTNALEHGRVRRANRELRESPQWKTELIGAGPGMLEVKSLIEKVAPTPARVLITGENGTGKEMVARAIHAGSSRRNAPFVEVNCAALPEELVESELFGHEKGAFTGAQRRREGKFERAHQGTLFLDEIGDMSPSAQAKVLRALEDQRIERVGGSGPIDVDVRILAATNRDLQDEQLEFRQDLFFRLNVISIRLPALRERTEDIATLFEHFLAQAAVEMKQQTKSVDPAVLDRLAAYAWPGNVRELKNLAERLAIVAPESGIRVADLPAPMGGRETARGLADFLDAPTFQDFKSASEAAFLQAKLVENEYNISRTAERLGMQRSNLYKKIQRYELRTSTD